MRRPLALLTACLLVTGCGSTADLGTVRLVSTTPPAGAGAGEVTWFLDSEPLTVDTDYQSGTTEDTVVANVCERLYQLQPDFTVRPWLVDEPVMPDPTTFVYRVRDGVRFHDGTAVTAEDVAFSLRRHAEDGNDESDEFSGVEAIEVTGPMQVTVRLEEPDAQFKYRMAGDAGIVLNADLVRRLGDAYGKPGQPDACSGPYYLDRWDAGSGLTLRRFRDYWNPELRPLTESVRFVWGDEWAVVNSLRTGAADGAYLDDPSMAPALSSSSQVSLRFGPTTSAWQLIPAGGGAMADRRLRTALSLALDREGMARAAFRGAAEPWKLPVGAGTFGAGRGLFERSYRQLRDVPVRPVEADLERARQLVREAGDPAEPIVLASDGTAVGNVLANGVRDAGVRLGLAMEIRTVPPAQFSELFASSRARADVDLIITDWYLSKPDGLGMYDNVLPGSVNNYLGFRDEQFERVFAEAAGTYDDVRRAEQVVRLQEVYLEHMLSIPLVMAPTALAMSTRLTGPPVTSAYLTYPWVADLGRRP
ncbi:ABC transporter substrate-binding protein [Saccharopolyspora erythraea]|uniref:ABC transporter substrate-binding protein n=1 Tax=Saccharopolyspora erythraea TaxID=1836 RepID=UPI001BAC5365|nr:ABC transporter substrate-binding protein [Saccharopolyspora erythraea]QUH03890.1 ABC transporter substrate-binding protein [Saccharopolyspora erythraea]